MKKILTFALIVFSLTSFSQVGGNKYTIIVKGDSTGGSTIDSAALAAKLILKANQSALIDSATALRSGINTKQPLLGFTPYNVTNPAGYIGNAALSPYLLSTTAASTYLGSSGNGSALTGLTKGQVGLANVDNTSDANKPVSTAQLTALNLKQNSLSGTGLVRMTGATVSYDNATYLTSVPAQTYASLTGKPDLTVYTLKADSIDGSKILKQTIPTLSFTGTSPVQVLNDSTATVSKQVFDSLARKAALTGFASAAGTVTSADSIISAFQKLNGNIEQVKRRTVASIVTATDANITALVGTLYNLPSATLSASRSINISALNQAGDYLEINNEENGYAWTITGATLYLGDGITVVTQLVTNATTQIRFNGTKIKIIN